MHHRAHRIASLAAFSFAMAVLSDWSWSCDSKEIRKAQVSSEPHLRNTAGSERQQARNPSPELQ